MGEIMEGRAAPAQIAGLLIGAVDEGRAARRDRRPRADDAGARRAGAAAATATCSTPAARAATARARSTSRRSPRSSSRRLRRAAWPSTATARSRAGAAAPTSSRRSASTSTAPPDVVDRCLDEVGHRLLLRADVPSVDEACGADAPGPRRPDGVQPAGTADQPGRRVAPARRRAEARADRAGRARAGAARQPSAPGSCTAPTASTRSRRRATRRCRNAATASSTRSTSIPAEFGLPEGVGGRLKGGDAVANARIARSVLPAPPGPARDIVLLNAGAALLIAGACDVGPGRHQEAARRIDDGDARPPCSTGWWRRRRHDRMSGVRAGSARAPSSRPRGAPWRCARSGEPGRRSSRRPRGREPRGHAFREALGSDRSVNVIAECKRRSPSRGVLRRDYDPAAIAPQYAAAGAAAISVLTEPTFFDGALDHLRAVRAAVPMPLLRKDFIVVELPAAGGPRRRRRRGAADRRRRCRTAELADLLGDARGSWASPRSSKCTTPQELARALDAGADIVGVNNRNLRTLEVIRGRPSELAGADAAARRRGCGERPESAADLAALRARGLSRVPGGRVAMTSADPGDAARAGRWSAGDAIAEVAKRQERGLQTERPA